MEETLAKAISVAYETSYPVNVKITSPNVGHVQVQTHRIQ